MNSSSYNNYKGFTSPLAVTLAIISLIESISDVIKDFSWWYKQHSTGTYMHKKFELFVTILAAVSVVVILLQYVLVLSANQLLAIYIYLI
jgi:hypothetical protein